MCFYLKYCCQIQIPLLHLVPGETTNMALRLLLVDDENITIQRICKRIDWKTLEIDEIRHAEDGIEALEQCDGWLPDILVSDVQMPRMNGIQLAEILRKRSASMQIIFISGYTDKEYLKSAIHLKAVNYIEKPIDLKECRQALQNAHDELCQQRHLQLQLSSYQDEHRRQLQTSIALSFASEHYQTETVAPLMTEFFPPTWHFSYCVALCLSFNREEERTLSFLNKCLPLVYGKADALSLLCCAAIRHNYIVIFLFSQDVQPNFGNYHAISDYCTGLSQQLFLYDAHFTLGVGRFAKKWENLTSSYRDAQQASAQAFYHDPGYIAYYRSFATQVYDFSSADPVSLAQSINKLSRDQFVFTIRSLVSNVRSCEATPPQEVKRFFSSLTLELRHMSENIGAPVWPDLQTEHDLVAHIMSAGYLDDLLGFFLNGTEQYYHFLETNLYSNATVNWIIRYIHQNYSDPDLSVTTISQSTNLSPTYICHLFKDITGNTLHNYITEYRMEKAAQLIRNPLSRVGDVAEMVGYRNGNYFSFRFKKSFGLSPSEYKEQNE